MLRDVAEKTIIGGWETGDDDEEIGYCEDVGDGSTHLPPTAIYKHWGKDQDISDLTDNENESVGDREGCTDYQIVSVPVYHIIT